VKPLKEWIQNLFAEDPPRRVLFRVDAGRVPGLSFGHLSRCLILSRVIGELFGSEKLFFMRGYDQGIRHARDRREHVRTLPIETPVPEEGEAVLKVCREFRPDWVIVDLPYADLETSYFPVLRNRGAKIFFIDDFRFTNPGADVVLNSSILAPDRTATAGDMGTKFLLGPDYFIFNESRNGPAIAKEGARNVLLTFGGSDPTGLTLKVLEALVSERWPDVYFRVILGPGYADLNSIKAVLSVRESCFGIEENPPDLVPFMRGCDLAVCAGGRTMDELHFLEKTFVPIATSDIEGEAVKEFIKRGLVPAGMVTWDPSEFRKIMKTILNNP
jgi:spore coat polysaccharide biosynthesis predicted glycosyltransferase SpsG